MNKLSTAKARPDSLGSRGRRYPCEATPWQALLVWLAAAACLAPFILRRRR